MIKSDKLDLACGNYKLEGFTGVDLVKTDTADYVMDLQSFPWPIEDNSVTEIRCSHYVEHIPHKNVAQDLQKIVNESSTFEEFKSKINSNEFLYQKDGFIKFMEECYRILKPSGKLTLIAPYYASHRGFGDPTHERYMCDYSWSYFNAAYRNLMALDQYDIKCDFDLTYSYCVTNEMTLKSEEVRNKAFLHDLNVIDDIIVEFTKI